MRTLILGLILAATSFAGAAHADNHLVAPTPGALKTYLQSAKVTPIKPSTAHNSQAYHFAAAMSATPSAFQTIKLGASGPDFGRTAYIPKTTMKGLAGNTAYIESESIAGPRLDGKVRLPLF